MSANLIIFARKFEFFKKRKEFEGTPDLLKGFNPLRYTEI